MWVAEEMALVCEAAVQKAESWRTKLEAHELLFRDHGLFYWGTSLSLAFIYLSCQQSFKEGKCNSTDMIALYLLD